MDGYFDMIKYIIFIDYMIIFLENPSKSTGKLIKQ